MERKYIVYIHTCPNNKVYIGITSQNPEKRWDNGKGYAYNLHFWRAIQKYGWNNIKHEILFDGLNEDEAKNKEKELIAQYKSNNEKYGYNLTEGGDGTCGYKQSEETKAKISKATSGENNPMYGKQQSEETKKKRSESMKGKNKGKQMSEESKEKNRQAHLGQIPWNKGKQQSEETKKKRSESMKKLKWYNNGEEQIRATECPVGFVAGRLKKK